MEAYSLHFAGVLLTFMLKVTAGFVLCTALACLLPNPRHRFLTWLAFLLASGVSWIASVTDETISFFSRASSEPGAVTGSVAGGEHFTVPAQWGIPLERLMVATVIVYLAAVLIMVGAKAYKHLRLRAWLRGGRKASPELEATFRELCLEFNIRRCRLTVLPEISSPATVYWWTPRVIVPEICEEIAGTPQLRNVLRHELIHTLRCDYLWASLCDLICALLFFIPAMWTAKKHLSMQRELACDLGVVETHPEHRVDYAESLARFVRLVLAQQNPSFGIDLVPAPSFLGTRIRCILAEPRKQSGWKRAFTDTAFVAAIIAFTCISPALSISIDLSPASRQGIETVPNQTSLAGMLPVHGTGTKRLKPHRNPVAETVHYQDTLTTLPLRNTIAAGSGLPESLQPLSTGSRDSELSPAQWRSAPAASYPNPVMAKVDLADVNRMPAGPEHHSHGRDKR
jgi:beta-lactamase regulating signal transducer with metallopeptidase domain